MLHDTAVDAVVLRQCLDAVRRLPSLPESPRIAHAVEFGRRLQTYHALRQSSRSGDTLLQLHQAFHPEGDLHRADMLVNALRYLASRDGVDRAELSTRMVSALLAARRVAEAQELIAAYPQPESVILALDRISREGGLRDSDEARQWVDDDSALLRLLLPA
jgi:hypothetical protein